MSSERAYLTVSPEESRELYKFLKRVETLSLSASPGKNSFTLTKNLLNILNRIEKKLYDELTIEEFEKLDL
ncbi:MAG TPA: hypothetical protein ENI27_03780 [bacterium]|nr:hypothetical protein [bacterium]